MLVYNEPLKSLYPRKMVGRRKRISLNNNKKNTIRVVSRVKYLVYAFFPPQLLIVDSRAGGPLRRCWWVDSDSDREVRKTQEETNSESNAL